MPHRRSSTPRTKSSTSSRGDFRRRYEDLEAKRAELMARLQAISALPQTHPGYKRARTLLNDTFRKSKLAQRLTVLQAAAWLIGVLEQAAKAL